MQRNIQIISDFKKICRETKNTIFPNKRYIIPRDWFDSIMNNQNFNHNIPINNSQFLNSSFKKFNNNIDERKIVLLIFELMAHIHKTFFIDYIIQADISFDNDNIIYINNIQVFNNNEFNETNISLTKKMESIKEAYLKYPQFQIIKNNNKSSDCSSSKIISINEREIISKTENETISTLSNSRYKYKETDSFSLFNLDSYKKTDLIPIGLKNPSIYCFMNCCLQILLSIPELNYFFLCKKYKQDLNHKTLICDDYSNFISLYQYFKNHNETQMDLTPSIIDICNSLVPKGIMHDCQEFLLLFIHSMQEELNHNYKNNYYKYENNIDDKDIEKRWNLYRIVNSSFTDSIFTGYIRSTVICNNCNNSSYNYEPFMNLSVPIPKSNKSIKKCLNIYFEIELIDCDYRCSNCKQNTSVTK